MVKQWAMYKNWGCVKKLQIYVPQPAQALQQGPINIHQMAVCVESPWLFKMSFIFVFINLNKLSLFII